MAERKIKTRSWLLYASEDGGTTEKVIACLNSKELNSSSSTIDASSDCGNDYLPGDLKEQSFAIGGFVTLGADATKVSATKLYQYWEADTVFFGRIKRFTEVAGDPSWDGDVFVSDLVITASDNNVVEFTATLTAVNPPLTLTIAS